jgi:hypothetical protein
MNPVLSLVLLVIALVCFGVSCFSFSAPFWNRLVSAGLTALVASMIRWGG